MAQTVEARNTALVQDFYRAAVEDDLPAALDLCAGDASWVYPEIEGVAWSREWHGHDGIVRWLELHDQEDELLDLHPEEFVAQGDRVDVFGYAQIRTRATGQEWETRFVHAVTVRQGKIQRFEAFFDTAACLQAHGLVAAA